MLVCCIIIINILLSLINYLDIRQNLKVKGRKIIITFNLSKQLILFHVGIRYLYFMLIYVFKNIDANTVKLVGY